VAGAAKLDGTGARQSYVTAGSEPFAMATGGQHICWANFGTGTIAEANLDGTGVNQGFITGANLPVGLAWRSMYRR
jgi:hypothetical protein